jgi:hypothetical protein
LATLDEIGVRPPVSVSLSLIGVRGLKMAMAAFGVQQTDEIREETLIIPGAIVENFSASPYAILKPMFDRIWNACGLLQSVNFDAQGKWTEHK